MDGVREFLEAVRQHALAKGHLRALLHIVIGRKIAKPDGTVLSAGITWRELSELLRVIRWEREQVTELGLDPETLPPRDRQRYWYAAISAAGVDSLEARNQAQKLLPALAAIGFKVV